MGRGGIGFLLRTQPGGDSAHIVGVDVHEPYLEFCARFGLYDELIHGDAATISFGQFDVVTAREVVEHIKAAKSAALLDQLKQIAKERIMCPHRMVTIVEVRSEVSRAKHISRLGTRLGSSGGDTGCGASETDGVGPIKRAGLGWRSGI